jgi:signal transduction histidine kinase
MQILLGIVCLGWIAAWTGGAQSPALVVMLPWMLFVGGLGLSALGISSFIAAAWLAAGAAAAWTEPVSTTGIIVQSVWAIALAGTAILGWRGGNALLARETKRIEQARRIGELASTLSAREAMLVHDERLAAVGRMTAGIAHEIANPLASMDSVLQLMQRQTDKPGPESIESLRTQVRRILQIVRQLTRHAHPGHGSLEVISLDDVVESSIDMLVFSKRIASVRAHYGLENGLGTVRVNASAMQQVVANLLVNALDATEHVEQPRVDVRTYRDDAWCVIEVADNGVGIKAEQMARIFEPFYTTKPVGRGTGLGLSICARLVEEQKGRIDVSSEVARGTTFQVRIPGASPTGLSQNMSGAQEEGGLPSTDVGKEPDNTLLGRDRTAADPAGAQRHGIKATR